MKKCKTLNSWKTVLFTVHLMLFICKSSQWLRVEGSIFWLKLKSSKFIRVKLWYVTDMLEMQCWSSHYLKSFKSFFLLPSPPRLPYSLLYHSFPGQRSEWTVTHRWPPSLPAPTPLGPAVKTRGEGCIFGPNVHTHTHRDTSTTTVLYYYLISTTTLLYYYHTHSYSTHTHTPTAHTLTETLVPLHYYTITLLVPLHYYTITTHTHTLTHTHKLTHLNTHRQSHNLAKISSTRMKFNHAYW